jgi:leader peptidase (prepilin peptidase)/N-methyltransferase
VGLDNLLSYGVLGVVVITWLGLCVGSFLNVVIYRLPVMLERQWTLQARLQLTDDDDAQQALLEADAEADRFDLMFPNSRCPGCGFAIKPWQNIPVLSWLLLRGRCGQCGNGIAARYPAIELLTALMSVAVIAAFGFTAAGGFALVFTWVLIAGTFIDFDTQLLPDQLTLPLLWLGLFFNLGVWVWSGFVSLPDAVIGAIAGYGALWVVFWGFKLATGKEGMGYGDFKLLGAIGAWLGWQVLPATILIASIAGLSWALFGIVVRRNARSEPIAFGPFLATGGWVALMFRDTVLRVFGGS